MDKTTLDKLEFDRIRQLLAQHAQCGLGRDLALRITPSLRHKMVGLWLEQAREFSRWVTAQGLPPFGGVKDVRELVRRAVPPAKLEPEEFAELASTLQGIDNLRRYFAALTAGASAAAREASASMDGSTEGDDPRPGQTPGGAPGAASGFEQVTAVALRIGDFRVVAERINEIIDSRAQVRDDASERLARIRAEIEHIKEQTRHVFDRILQQQATVKLLQYPNATYHADRMVLPLKAEQRGRIQGIVHRSSDSGQTLFVEPAEAVELNNKRIKLLVDEKEEIARILWELTHLVHLNQAEVLRTLEAVAVIDLLTAKVKFARHYHLHLPQVNTEHKLVLRHARNPILMAAFEEAATAGGQARKVVPIDVRLGDDFDIMILTGPNTGGKTATLKTVGLLAAMAHAGLPIPAGESSTIPLLDGLYIDVGDEQSLVQSLSTFSAHMRRILDILQHARRDTLVLLDELGAGTDPDEGAAIGRAIVDRLLVGGSLGMITTHLGALKAVGFEKERVDNGSVQFSVETLQPTYELRIGEPGESHAITISARLGMPRKMVHAARLHLADRHRALNRAIAGTYKARREAERARKDADSARQEAAKATLAAIDRAAALEASQRQYRQWVEKIMRLRSGDEVRVRTFENQMGRIVRVGFEKQHAVVDLGAIQVEVPLADLILDGK